MDLNKKIIFILNHYSHNSQSHFFHIINLLEEITKLDVEVALIIEKCEDDPIINNPSILVFPQKNKNKIKRVIELFRLLWKLQKQGYKKVFVRISWVAACVAIIVSFFSNIKTYYWLSGASYPNFKFGFNKIKYAIRTLFPLWVIKNCAYKFATGPESMVEYYIKYFGVKRSKIILLYNDIDTNRFKSISAEKRSTIKKEMGYGENEKLLLYVKRLSSIKGTNYYFPYILDKFYSIPENLIYRTIIIGEGSEKELLISNISQKHYSKQVSILGGIPNKEIQKYYNISDIFINCTLEEGFPRVLIEAMACGLPIVTTDVGGIKDILGDVQLNYMSKDDDLESFSKNLIKMTQLSQTEFEIIKNENLEVIKKFTTPNVAAMYIKTIFNN